MPLLKNAPPDTLESEFDMISEYQNYTVAVDDRIAILTVNRPEVHNAMNYDCWVELCQFMDWVESEDAIGAVIITGAGDKAFVAGADVRVLAGRTGTEAWQDKTGVGAMARIQQLSKPVIAAVNGSAFGGGCELATACDIRIVSENAKFGMPEVGLGIMPGLGGTQRLARLVGEGRAKEMVMAGRILRGQEAVDAGLAIKCVPQKMLLEEAKTLANRMLRSGPLSLAFAKQAIQTALSTDQKTGEQFERLCYCVLMGTKDKEEGVASFLEKRPAQFQGK